MREADLRLDMRLLRALGDPVRQRILTILNERVATGRELAAEVGIARVEVQEHLLALIADDAIECVGHDAYRAAIRPFLDDAHWAQLPVERRRALFVQNVQQIIDHVQPALAGGGFDDIRSHVSLTRVDLDAQGWEEVADLLAGVLEEVMDVHAESMERVQRGESREVIPAELAVLHFRRADRGARQQNGGETTTR
jgi:DNA-binding transcriptional ArsR family regulator